MNSTVDSDKAAPTSSGKRHAIHKRQPGSSEAPPQPVMSRLLHYVVPHTGMIALVVTTIALTSAAELAAPWFIRWGIDGVIGGGTRRNILLVAAGLLGLSLVQGSVDFVRLTLMSVTGERIVFGIRNALFSHITRLSFSFHDKARTGDLMSRVTSDVDILTQFFSRALGIVVTNILTLAGILIVALSWDWRLGLLYLCILPGIVWGMIIYARRVQPAMARSRRTAGALTAAIQQTLSGISVVKLFGSEEYEHARVDSYSRNLTNITIETTRISAFWMPYANMLAGIAAALVLWGAGISVIHGHISVGTLVGFSMYMAMLLRPIRQTGMMLNVFMRSMTSARRVFETMDIDPEIHDSPGAYPLPTAHGAIRFANVAFSYNHDGDTLADIDLEIAPGELTAIVGPSGAGKTTLVNLLLRFYDAHTGTISIDNHDIRRVTVKSLRETIGIAMQNVFLFDASIGENIAYGRDHVTHTEITWAANTVRLHDFVESLPMGYDTPVGERGVSLSGGQKQRIALARVLLTDPRILILDEPTSNIDARTENEMRDALENVWRNRTTIVIAHRLWTVSRAGQIVVMQNGRIVEKARGESGRSAHDILMGKNGIYSRLYSLQQHTETIIYPGTEEGLL